MKKWITGVLICIAILLLFGRTEKVVDPYDPLDLKGYLGADQDDFLNKEPDFIGYEDFAEYAKPLKVNGRDGSCGVAFDAEKVSEVEYSAYYGTSRVEGSKYYSQAFVDFLTIEKRSEKELGKPTSIEMESTGASSMEEVEENMIYAFFTFARWEKPDGTVYELWITQNCVAPEDQAFTVIFWYSAYGSQAAA